MMIDANVQQLLLSSSRRYPGCLGIFSAIPTRSDLLLPIATRRLKTAPRLQAGTVRHHHQDSLFSKRQPKSLGEKHPSLTTTLNAADPPGCASPVTHILGACCLLLFRNLVTKGKVGAQDRQPERLVADRTFIIGISGGTYLCLRTGSLITTVARISMFCTTPADKRLSVPSGIYRCRVRAVHGRGAGRLSGTPAVPAAAGRSFEGIVRT